MVGDDVSLRPLQVADEMETFQVTEAAFHDLEARLHIEIPHPPEALRRERFGRRFHHLLESDAAGAWGAVCGGRLHGVALALRREDVWGLSLLVVVPGLQSAGCGGELLRRSLEHGHDCGRGIIMSSPDPRALRAYVHAGFAIEPTLMAAGLLRRERLPAPSPSVRDGVDADLGLIDDLDRTARGGSRRPDVELMLAADARLLVAEHGPQRGYAVARDGSVLLLATTDAALGQALVTACLATGADGEDVTVGPVIGGQDWAVAAALEVGLQFLPLAGGILHRGDCQLAGYLANGAYL